MKKRYNMKDRGSATKTEVYEKELMEFNINERQKKFLETYVDSRNITKSAIEAGISRDTFYKWSKYDNFLVALDATKKEAKRRRELEEWEKVDRVEEALIENALAGKENSQMFYLKNRAPERWRNDYIQGQQYIQNQQNNLNVFNVRADDMSNEELQAKILAIGERMTWGRKMKDETKALSRELEQLNGEIADIMIRLNACEDLLHDICYAQMDCAEWIERMRGGK